MAINYQFWEGNPFLSIPQKKIDGVISDVKRAYSDSNGVISESGAILLEIFNRYALSNIPCEYWYKDMGEFTGDKALLQSYNSYTRDVEVAYDLGMSVCYAGNHGRGKTMTSTCILKKVIETGLYSTLYVNLTDIISVLSSSDVSSQSKSEAKRVLHNSDFLVIDEFDSRFMGSDNAVDLFGRTLEPIVRGRIQNKLPTILCTNNTDPTELFNGQLKQSFKSLMKKMKIISVLGTDHRGK